MSNDYVWGQNVNFDECEEPHGAAYRVLEGSDLPNNVISKKTGLPAFRFGVIAGTLICMGCRSVLQAPVERASEEEPEKHLGDAIIPDHYGGREDPYEVFKVIRAWELNFFLGNVLKYIRRAGKKDPSKRIEDLKKAREYLDSEIAELEAQEAQS